jgi:hypothetical protein
MRCRSHRRKSFPFIFFIAMVIVRAFHHVPSTFELPRGRHRLRFEILCDVLGIYQSEFSAETSFADLAFLLLDPT